MQHLYQGIIENNIDPLKMGRYQVRIFGIHTENRNDEEKNSYIPTEDLPWALSVSNGANIDEQGDFIPMQNGSFVIISFLDPEKQKPIIIGSISRIVLERPNFNKGFSDPNSVYPDNEHMNESSISRLARNENIDQTIIQSKKDNKKLNVNCNGIIWHEPETEYNTVYPKNRVIQTKHHIFEMDDTDGKERIHIYHKSGSAKEYFPNGDVVEHIKNKKYTITLSDDNILIEGNQNIKINGNQNIQIDGIQNIKANTSINIESPIMNLIGTVNILNDIVLSGNLTGSGNINLSGSIMDGTGNSNHHSH